jgi:hypothetical protein
LTGEEAELAQELERAKGDEGHLGRLTVVLDDVEVPLEDDYQVIGLVAVGEENVTWGETLLDAVTLEHLELRRAEYGMASRLFRR